MHYVLYPSRDAAMLAAGAWARDTRADWNLHPMAERPEVRPGLVQPCDRDRLTGAPLAGVTIRAEGAFARYGQRYAGRASRVFAAAWEVAP